MSNTITLPNPNELALNIESELHKLPTEAAHNHFHNLAESADKIQEQAKAVSLVSLILCGLELQHLQEANKAKGKPDGKSGLPWKQWVTENCEFTYMTATKYIKAAKCARLGMLEGLDAALVPNCAPSQMSATELQDTCAALANGLQGFGSRRQLYLKLDIIKTPQRQTIDENRQKKGTVEETSSLIEESGEPIPADESSSLSEAGEQGVQDLKDSIDIDKQDARDAILPTLKPLDDFLKLNKHTLLERAELEQLDQALQSARDLLKPYLKPAAQ